MNNKIKINNVNILKVNLSIQVERIFVHHYKELRNLICYIPPLFIY